MMVLDNSNRYLAILKPIHSLLCLPLLLLVNVNADVHFLASVGQHAEDLDPRENYR